MIEKLLPKLETIKKAEKILYDCQASITTFELSEERGNCITGTDMTSLLDLNDFKTKYQLIGEKIGALPKQEVTSDQADIGLYMEPYLLARAIIQHEQTLRGWAEDGACIEISMGEFLKHETLPLGCSMDAIVWVNDEPQLSWEFKTTAQVWPTIPLKVHAQVQSQLMCNGLSVSEVWYMDKTHKVQIEAVEADPEWEAVITKAAKWAWPWIERKEMPEPEEHEKRTPVPTVKGKRPAVLIDDEQVVVQEAMVIDISKQIAEAKRKLEELEYEKKQVQRTLLDRVEFGARLKTRKGLDIYEREQVFGAGLKNGDAYKALKIQASILLKDSPAKHAALAKLIDQIEKANYNKGVLKTVIEMEVPEEDPFDFASSEA